MYSFGEKPNSVCNLLTYQRKKGLFAKCPFKDKKASKRSRVTNAVCTICHMKTIKEFSWGEES